MNEKKLINRECRFAVHIPNKKNDKKDLHVIKEILHYDDNTKESNLKLIYDYKRPFYITKKGYRNHEDKKEAEDISKLDEFKSTQSQLVMNVSKALNIHKKKINMRELAQSPYLYGVDISSTSLIKKQYEKVTKFQTPYSVAVFDVETDVLNGTSEIIISTVSFKDKVYTAVKSSFLKGKLEPIKQVLQKSEVYLNEYIKNRNIKLEIEIFDNEIDLVKNTLRKLHEWKPDLVAVWNIYFDMSKILDACKKVDLDPALIMSDPIIPDEYKYFYYKEGASKKRKASGEVSTISPQDRWHKFVMPASFHWVDAMCIYRYVRIADQQEPKYSLDYILNKNLNINKLKIKEVENLSGIEFHKTMQDKFPIEYIVYNIFDCISIELLDEKTKDMTIKFPLLSEATDFNNFSSQPKKIVDLLHFFYLEEYNKIFASASEDMTEDSDEFMTLKDWIVTLPSYLITEQGLRIIKENNNIATNIYTHVYDSDVASGYPNGSIVFNISKETTTKELVSINDVSEFDKRMGTINFSAGHVNSLEFCNKLLKMPTLDQWNDLYLKLN